MDAHVPGWLWPILSLSGIGALIDFLIGRVGQDRVRDFLLEWWVRFDDVEWNNFAKKEALFSVFVIDECCGRRFFSVRRLIFLIYIFLLVYAVMLLVSSPLVSTAGVEEFSYFLPNGVDVTATTFAAVSLSISISFNRKLATIVARLCEVPNVLWNLIIFLLFFAFCYACTIIWVSIAEWSSLYIEWQLFGVFFNDAIRTSYLRWFMAGTNGVFIEDLYKKILAISFDPSHIIQTFTNEAGMYVHKRHGLAFPLGHTRAWLIFPFNFVRLAMVYFGNIARLLLAVLFLGLFLLRLLLRRPLSLLWQRTVESDKPIFTLLLGGLGGLGTALNELMKHVGL
jgi:hypothetical protein